MFNLRLSAILIAICFLAAPFNDGLLPLAQAQSFILTPTLKDPDFHDTANPVAPVLEKPNDALASLARDRKDAIDWMQILNSGIIVPRTSSKEKVMEEMDILDMDIIMTNTKAMPYVKFPHRSHTRWLACVNCHNEIFAPKAGDNPVNMYKIFLGQYCGVCHGKVAFTPTNTCERCHSIPHGDTAAWW